MNLPIQIPPSKIDQYQVMGLSGRRYRSNGHKKNFLILGGQHTSLERMYAIAQFLNDYGSVEMIDLPGFGGMQSFRSVGKTIDLDNYADFLYQYLKNENNKYTVFATSFSSMVVTRMLQLYPDANKFVIKNIMFVGLNSYKNFDLPFFKNFFVKVMAITFSNPVMAKIFEVTVTNKYALTLMLWFFSTFKANMKSDSRKKRFDNIAMEFSLWRENDRETHAKSALIMFSEDLTISNTKVSVPAHNVLAKNDQYFDNESVNRGFKDIYQKYTTSYIKLEVHAPSLMAEKQEVANIMSDKTISILRD